MNRNKNKFRRYIIFFLLFLVLIGGLVILFWDYLGTEEEVEPETEETEQQLVFENTGFELFNHDNTQQWVLKAENMVYFQERGEIEIKPVTIEIFDLTVNREHSHTITAERGEYEEKEGLLFLSGEVKIEEVARERKFRTDRMYWYQEEDLIQGRGGVVLETRNFVLKGEEFDSDSHLEKIVFDGGGEVAHFRLKEE